MHSNQQPDDSRHIDRRTGTVRCVGGILHDATGRILLINRAHAPAAGRWSIPGGKVEPGEPDDVAVARELREETGLTVVVRAWAGTVISGTYEIHDYRCDVAYGTLRAGDDASAARWFTGTELRQLELHGELTDALFDTLREWDLLPA